MIGLIIILIYASAAITLTYHVLLAEDSPTKSRGFIASTLSALVQDRQDKANREIGRWRKILGERKDDL
jgi:hypothetical protein